MSLDAERRGRDGTGPDGCRGRESSRRPDVGLVGARQRAPRSGAQTRSGCRGRESSRRPDVGLVGARQRAPRSGAQTRSGCRGRESNPQAPGFEPGCSSSLHTSARLANEPGYRGRESNPHTPTSRDGGFSSLPTPVKTKLDSGHGGLEPPTHRFGTERSSFEPMPQTGRGGLEPPTPWFATKCSSSELTPHSKWLKADGAADAADASPQTGESPRSGDAVSAPARATKPNARRLVAEQVSARARSDSWRLRVGPTRPKQCRRRESNPQTLPSEDSRFANLRTPAQWGVRVSNPQTSRSVAECSSD